MTENEERIFKEEVTKKLSAAFMDGMSQGSKAMCGVILETLNSDKQNEEKIEIIKDFCERSLGLAVID